MEVKERRPYCSLTKGRKDKERPYAGNGRRRSISCPSCNGQAEGNKLLAPLALACGAEGSIFVGDFNYIRRIFPSGNVSSVMELSNNPAHRYYLATDPVSGQLFVSDTNSRRIYRPKLLSGARELIGIAVDKNGFIYFVDGTMIRKVDRNGIVSTLLGSNDLTSARPLTCDSSMHIRQVRLEWPTDLAINPMDNSIYVLDNNVVLQITENRQVRIVAGRPMHCQVPGVEYIAGKRAVQTMLEGATAIALSYSGILYIAETDEKKIHRIRQVSTDGEITHLAGAPSDCDCKNDANCDCYQTGDGYAKDARLNCPSSLVVSPDGTLFVADLGNIRIRAVRSLASGPSSYEVASPSSQELYVFDSNGTHQFTINEEDITAVTDSSGNTLRIRRDTNRMPVRVVAPDNQGQELVLFSYHGNSGLLATKSVQIGWTTFYDYDSEGRLTNVTFPTGVVTNLHGDMASGAVAVDIETSGREEDVSITTNLSSVDSFYTLVQDQLRNSYEVGNDHSLRVNGRNLLSVDYDRSLRTEKIYDDHRKFLLKIVYDTQGHPSLWVPSSKLLSVNLTYSSQHQYIFDYDAGDRLSAVTMPSVARHTMQTVCSVGYYRNIYSPPESNASLLRVAHLGTGRRILYKYRRQNKLAEILYDSTRVSFTYDETAGVLKTVNLQSEGFICSIRYRQVGPLVDRQIFRFSEDGMVNARFDYTYDNSFRVTSMQAVINETPLPIDLYQFDDISGKVEQFGKFGVIYYDINQIISTAVMTYTKHFDQHGRIKEIQYEIFRSLMYWITVQYDTAGRVTKREIKIGPFANTTKYAYEYDVDGQLQAVFLGEKLMWRDRITRLGDVQYRLDEDGFLRQRGAEIFEYNSKGLLERVYSKSAGWTIQYRYDGLGRRVSSRNSLGQHLQFFYADLTYPTRITHGHLFAMEISSGEEFYILQRTAPQTNRDYDIPAGRWTTPDMGTWVRVGKEPQPFNLYMFRNNNPVSKVHQVKEYVTDVNIWLVTFGFHLHNAIPGFPIPKFDLTTPSLEMKKTVQQEVTRQAKAFLSFERMPEIQLSRRRVDRDKPWLWFATVKSLIGKGVMLAVTQGRVVTNALNIANEDCIKVAAILNNAFHLEDLHFTVDGRDTHYFIKTTLPESDLGTLRLTSGRRSLENGVNVTVAQSTAVVNGRTRRFADVELQRGALALHVRYGMTLDEEKARILEQARQRALAGAWAREQQHVRDGEEGVRLWTEGEKRQLLSGGKVLGYDGYYVLSVEQYPELADSANNIQFLRQSEIGKR
ncbi:hypothetical protein NHX12_018126 [Muraenolepis orangiensis]|uniref:Tox-GHH domain-containing protein n=1 Tax=Muraenolepis orangiensis TaxID=630683 RepID=A0A9Q0EWF4_9TELE|nr:hypothetical protein NHX12_018126 [Muraenolepis orangiensis]